MDEEIQFALDSAEESMNSALERLSKELTKVRAGRANPSMLDGVRVDYYGSSTPLSQVSNVNTLDARTLTVQPWEKAMLDPISKAIIDANLGLNPQNNGEMIMINIPVLTEDRRKELVKKAKAEGEHAKVSLRNARKTANDEIKGFEKDGLSEDLAKDAEGKVQTLTDSYVAKIDTIVSAKEKDIMTV